MLIWAQDSMFRSLLLDLCMSTCTWNMYVHMYRMYVFKCVGRYECTYSIYLHLSVCICISVLCTYVTCMYLKKLCVYVSTMLCNTILWSGVHLRTINNGRQDMAIQLVQRYERKPAYWVLVTTHRILTIMHLPMYGFAVLWSRYDFVWVCVKIAQPQVIWQYLSQAIHLQLFVVLRVASESQYCIHCWQMKIINRLRPPETRIAADDDSEQVLTTNKLHYTSIC